MYGVGAFACRLLQPPLRALALDLELNGLAVRLLHLYTARRTTDRQTDRQLQSECNNTVDTGVVISVHSVLGVWSFVCLYLMHQLLYARLKERGQLALTVTPRGGQTCTLQTHNNNKKGNTVTNNKQSNKYISAKLCTYVCTHVSHRSVRLAREHSNLVARVHRLVNQIGLSQRRTKHTNN